MAIVAQVNATMENAAKDVARKSALKLTPVLRDMAFRAEWPSDIIIQLKVDAVDANLVVSYPEELEERINNLEYGSEDSSATPVIRPFTYRFSKNLEQEVSDTLANILAEMGVLN
jgi:hypothetical protein